MSFGTIKRRPADILYSQWLRKERPRCERCYSGRTLQVSHFFGRANENLRFNPLNTDVLCFSCHQFFTSNPNEYVIWKVTRMGKKEYDKLVLEANVKKKRDDKLIIIWLNKLMGKETKEKSNKQCVHNGKKYVSDHCSIHMPRKKGKKKEVSDGN